MTTNHRLILALLLAAASHATRADGPARDDPHRAPSAAEWAAWKATFFPQADDLSVEHAEFPPEIRGVWEDPEYGCRDDSGGDSGSDARITIDNRILYRYEDTDELAWIQTISNRPEAWLVLAITNIAPPEVQDPEIYVRDGNHLVITDGTGATTYVRCQ